MAYNVVDDLQHATNSIDFNTGKICIHYGIKLGSYKVLDKTVCRAHLSLHPRSEWTQDAPLKGAGISNIEYRLHEFRSDGCRYLVKKKKEHQAP
ncbi:hypothetical protein ACFL2E_07940 [Thermodesulfobacteriota bacterium]